ncbi:MAG: hypothetical protein AAF849_09580 [Bacteroidota bacterium]
MNPSDKKSLVYGLLLLVVAFVISAIGLSISGTSAKLVMLASALVAAVAMYFILQFFRYNKSKDKPLDK